MKKIIWLVLGILLLSSCSSNIDVEQVNKDKFNQKSNKVEVKVTDKTIKRYDDKDNYLIYTNKWVYTIKDSILNWQFRSSDIYWYLEKDKCYSLGLDRFSWRIPFLSIYENIVSAKEIECE